MGKQILSLLLLVMAGASSLPGLIPFPQRDQHPVFPAILPAEEENVISETFGSLNSRDRIESFPAHTLVLMVEFTDYRFEDTITNQDFLANPDYKVRDYIERFMYHLQTYYLDASNDTYQINYSVPDTVITLPKSIAYYGDADYSLERRVELVQDLLLIIDPVIDFSDYDSYVILHSGAGRETDLYGTSPNAISSSFLNRRLLQAILDPDNEDDDYPGLETDDGVYLKEIVISATNHNHPDNPEDLNYGIIGLLCNLFGRQMGLPTLFGNVSSLGRAAGAGNFCVMGTGVWNANGHVPPFPSAWTRYFAGWTEPILLQQSGDNLSLTYPFNREDLHIPRLYRVPISDDEYYLIENRQQNPDGSELGGQPSFTFRLLPEGEQDYYDEPFDMVPRFNFMKNSYRGCEWDFYLPGLGGPDFPEIDGSGILIWHVDENIIRENYESNTINANPNHQGITLMEADGIQHLRSSIPDLYMRGSPYDSYRAGHNDYFGKFEKDDGTISVPYVQSFYGEAELEIHSISSSDVTMEFSVSFPWSLAYGYEGSDLLPGSIIRDSQDDIYLLQTTKSGEIYLFKNHELLPDYPVITDSIRYLHTKLENSDTFIIPVDNSEEGAAYHIVTPDWEEKSSYFAGLEWGTHPIAFRGSESALSYILALRSRNENTTEIYFYDDNFELFNWLQLENWQIVSNMIQSGNQIIFLVESSESEDLEQVHIDPASDEASFYPFSMAKDRVIRSLMMAPVTRRESGDGEYENNFIILTEENILYLTDEAGEPVDGFPLYFDDDILSIPSLADINRNGRLEMLLVSNNSLYVVGYNGEMINYPVPSELPYPEDESKNLGVIAYDLDRDDNPEIIANLGGNRFVIWDNSFRLKNGYPLLTANQPLNYPMLLPGDNSTELYLSAANGYIYRHSFPLERGSLYFRDNDEGWFTEYGNLQRSARYTTPLPPNTLETDKIFIKENCYPFPVPVTYQNGGVIYFNIMINQNLPVEVKIFDISGKLIFKEVQDCQAYTNNRNKVSLDINGLSTGVYFAQLSAKGERLILKFAVEK